MGVDSPGPVFNPNSQNLYGFYSVDGYDSLHSSRLDDFWGAVDPTVQPVIRGNPYSNVFVRPQAYTSTLASLFNVRYIASSSPLAEYDWLKQVYSGEIRIYRNERALSRAFLVGGAAVLTPAELKAQLSQQAFDPMKAVLLEAGATYPSISTTSNPAGTIEITSYKINSVEISADLKAPAWLVLADAYYPGWHATVDGREQAVYPAYGLLRTLPLREGRHVVRFNFIPTTFVPALVVSVTTLLILLIVALGARPPRNRGRRPSAGWNQEQMHE